MIAVDSTVLADLLFGDERCSRAAAGLRTFDPEWICLDLAFYEVGNVAWKMARFDRVELTDAKAGLRSLWGLLTEVSRELDEGAVLDGAARDGLTFYDASHVWFARSRGLELRTRDRAILRCCPDVAKPMPKAPK